MNRKSEINKLSKYIQATLMAPNSMESIIQLVYERFEKQKTISQCAHQLIKDKRYHEWAGIFNGFMWELHQTKNPSIVSYNHLIGNIARTLNWPLLTTNEIKNLILETLIIHYFDASEI